MPTCKHCGNYKFFKFDENYNLCLDCAGLIIPVINKLGECLNVVIELHKKETDYLKKVEQAKDIITLAEKLKDFEIKGIKTITPLPSDIIHLYKDYHTYYEEYFFNKFFKAQSKADQSYDDYKKNKLLLKELKEEIKNCECKNKLKDLAEIVKNGIDTNVHHYYNDLIYRTKELLKKHTFEEALKNLYDALIFLKTEKAVFRDQKQLIFDIEEWIKDVELQKNQWEKS